MVHCWRSRPPHRGLLLVALGLLAFALPTPTADRSRSASGDGYPPLLNDDYQPASNKTGERRSRMPEITPPDAAAWTAEDEPGHGAHFAGYLPDTPAHISDPVGQLQSTLPQTPAPRAEFSGNESAERDERPREGNRGLRLRKRSDDRENLAHSDDEDQNDRDDAADAGMKRRSKRSAWPEKKRNQDDVALTRKKGRSEVMDDFRHNPSHNDNAYVPFLGTVEDGDDINDKAEADDTAPRQELGEAKSVARAAAAKTEADETDRPAAKPKAKEGVFEDVATKPAARKAAPAADNEPPARDKYADMVMDAETQQEKPQTAVAHGDAPDTAARQPAVRSEPPPPPPVRNPPQIADLEPWRQQQYLPRPTRAEVEDYRRRLEQRLLERYNNLPRFAGKVGKVSVVLSRQLDESLDGNLIRAEFDQLVYDPWGKRIPELEQEYYVVTFGAGGARQVRSDPSIRVGLDMEKTYSERAPLNADPFRNVPEQKVFHSAPTAKMPDWWRPDFPELNQ